jgi:hypothetical protein
MMRAAAMLLSAFVLGGAVGAKSVRYHDAQVVSVRCNYWLAKAYTPAESLTIRSQWPQCAM